MNKKSVRLKRQGLQRRQKLKDLLMRRLRQRKLQQLKLRHKGYVRLRRKEKGNLRRLDRKRRLIELLLKKPMPLLRRQRDSVKSRRTKLLKLRLNV